MRSSVLWLAFFCHSGGVVSFAEAGLTERLAVKNFEDDATPSFIVLGVGGFRIPGQKDYTDVVNTAPAQEFVASVGGPLSSVSAFVQTRLSAALTEEPLIVEVRESTAGLPSDLLGSVILSPDRFTNSFAVAKSTFDFGSQGIFLTADQPYFVVFRTEEPGRLNTVYHTRTFDPNPLSLGIDPIFSGTGGTAPWFDIFQAREIGLEVRVIPEPLILALVDIKPGSFPNPVNLKSKGVLPVAILGTTDFDVKDVDFDSLRFGDPLLIDNGGTAVSPLRSSLVDISGDGLLDLTLKFSTRDLVEFGALGFDTIEGLLTGLLKDGTSIEGMDSIRIVPPNGHNGNSLQTSTVPEPTTSALALAAFCLAISRRRM